MNEALLLWGFGLLAAALLVFVIEVFLPTGGVLGITSAVLAIASVVAFWRVSEWWGVSSLLVVLILGPICFSFALRVMPHTPVGRRLILGDEDTDDQAREQRTAELRDQEQSLIGAEGVALTDLRPVGVAEIDGTRVEVRAESGMIESGMPVRVVEVQGNQVKVRALA